MSMRLQRLLVILLGLSLLSGCSGNSSASLETITAEDVIRTAEAIAAATLSAATETPTRSPATPTDTPVPFTDTPAPSATPDVPIAVPNYNANVRSGPGEGYEVIDFFLEGQQAQISGQYLDEQGLSWLFLSRIEEGRDGWIFFGAVTIYGNMDSVPFLVVEEAEE
jgi:uncharacterized protein YgiM (DUF1202 family)